MEDTIQAAVDAWLKDPAIEDSDKEDVRRLCASGDSAELTDRFYRRLAFGTGGIRGVIGAGLNRINVYTVGAAAEGLARYVEEQGSEACEAGVAVAYDCRRMSPEFARRTVEVMAGHGIRSHLFSALRPTPQLSYAVRRLGATAGVVITASHNPPEYNGFKVYWSDGGQIVPPQDHDIMERVSAVASFGDVKRVDFEDVRAAGRVQMLGEEMDAAFLDEVQQACLVPELCREQGGHVAVVFTSLHGTGGTLIPQALSRRGFERVSSVPEQAAGDGEFPTVSSPNPEEAAALAMGIDVARREQADLVIGTDPDADRMGIAVPDASGEFVTMSGNRIAALMTYFICEQLKHKNLFPEHAVVITTVVSGSMMKDIARSYGAEVIETLTGFKWIGQWIRTFEEDAAAGRVQRRYVFGAEESYGYLPATFARDKDAVTSAAVIADIAAWARSRGTTLFGLMEQLFQQFGYYEEALRSVTLKGRAGAERIAECMAALRSDPPAEIGGLAVSGMVDYQAGRRYSRPDGAVLGRIDLPSANVVALELADGSRAIARPSGTEPKIKFYILTREPSGDLAEARRLARGKIDAIMEDMVRRAGA